MNEKYVDWTKAPEGTTHVVSSFVTGGGKVSSSIGWERHKDGIVYGLHDGSWAVYRNVEDVAISIRIKRPEQETNKMIKRDETYTLEVTGEQLFWIAFLTGRTNGGFDKKSILYRKVAEMLYNNPTRLFEDAGLRAVDLNDLASYEAVIDRAMDKVFTPPKTKEQQEAEKQQQEYDKLMSQISELQTQAEKFKPKGV